MAGGEFGSILLVGALIVGGIFLLQNPGVLQQFAPQAAPPMEAEAAPEGEPEPEAEEPPPEPEVRTETEYVPYPVPVPGEPEYQPPPRPLTRKQICSRYYGGSCVSECRQYGYGSRICQQCIGYCGPPPPEYPRPRHYIPDRPRYDPPPRPRPFPKPGRECPRGQRYNWQKRKCEVITPQPGPGGGGGGGGGPPSCPSGQKWDRNQKKCVPNTPTPPPSEQPPAGPSTSPDAGEPESTGQPPTNANYGYSYYSGWY